jgi:hypothetical protein
MADDNTQDSGQDQNTDVASCAPGLGAIVGKFESLGINLKSSGRLSETIFDQVKADIQKEKDEAAKVKAKDIITKAVTIYADAQKTEREFKKAMERVSKELGGLFNNLNQVLDKPAQKQQPNQGAASA